jgi:hypothetical protein
MRASKHFHALVVIGMVSILGPNVRAAPTFSAGDVSFADEAISYSPRMVGSDPLPQYRVPETALGAPDYHLQTVPHYVSCRQKV